jgi:peptide/nickel transport system permease protein
VTLTLVQRTRTLPGRTTWRSLGVLDYLGVVIVTVVVLAAVIGPLVAPDVNQSNILASLEPPSAAHWLGTDEQGRDVLWRIVVGTRTTVGAAAGVVAGYSLLGVIVATVAVVTPRWAGDLVMRGADVVLAFPSLIFALLVAALFGSSVETAMFALIATGWALTARLLAGIMREKLQEPFVEGARTLGASKTRLMLRHVLPNSLPALRVKWAGDLGVTILLIGGLSFVGAGAQPPSAEWGAMVIAAQSEMQSGWWAALFPGLAIAITSMGFALFGDLLERIDSAAANSSLGGFL